MSVDPLAVVTFDPNKPPWDSNQAIPTLLVGRFRAALARAVPNLLFEKVERFAFAAYPLSGGFQPWSLLPENLVRPLLKLEWSNRGLFGRLCAFRLLAVYRKTADALESPFPQFGEIHQAGRLGMKNDRTAGRLGQFFDILAR